MMDMNDAELERQIKALEGRAEQLRDDLTDAERKLANLRTERLYRKHNVRPGDIIEDKRGKRYILDRAEDGGWSTYAFGRLIKKDGSVSDAVTRIWREWKKVPAAT